MSTGKLVTGVLIGAAAGAALGILFAPAKGSKTRKKISRKAADLKDSFKSKVNGLVDDLTDRYEEITDKAGKLVEDGKEKAASVKSSARHALS